MRIPEDLRYTKEHEWVQFDNDNIATIGVTDFAQESLGDITYVQLPKESTEVSKDDTFGVVESVKAVSDLYAPVSGRVIEVNQSVVDAPELVNQDPYGDGWMLKVDVKDVSELDSLMSPKEYSDYVEEKK